MRCDKCNVLMITGTSYEKKNGKEIVKRYVKCPKCFVKKYNTRVQSYDK